MTSAENTNNPETKDTDEEIVDKTPEEVIAERDNLLSKAKAKRDGKISKSEAGMNGLLEKAEEQKISIIETANNLFLQFEQKCNSNDDDSKQETVANLLAKAVGMRDTKIANSNLTYDNIVKKTKLKHKNICEKEHQKYDGFEEQLIIDYERKLVIAERIARKKNKEKREAAKQERTQQRIDKARIARENEQKFAQENIERIKNLKPKKKKVVQQQILVKAKLPEKVLKMKDSKGIARNVKRYTGRYCFMCFWNSNEKSFAKYFDKLSVKYFNNIAWMNCGPLGDTGTFQAAMLLYEFNATPAVVICFNGKTSSKHRYILGDTQESRDILKKYADECNVEEE